MTISWDAFQEPVRTEMKKARSEIAIHHTVDRRNVGNLDDADGFARITGPCGDTMEIWLKVRGDTITQATFMTDGCSTTIAAGSICLLG